MNNSETISYDITYMWSLKNNRDESIYKTETNSTYKHRKQTYERVWIAY